LFIVEKAAILFAGRGRRGSARRMTAIHVLLFLFGWLQDLFGDVSVVVYVTRKDSYLERTQKTLIHTHHCACVVKLTTVVRCAEKRNQLPLREELIPVFDDLVCAADEIHVMFLEEAGYHVRSKGERDTSVVFAPARDVFVRIGP
jgi:hypothetical protein